MAAAVARAVEVPARPSTPTAPHLTLNTRLGDKPSQVPNKHIPFCSPGPQPSLHHGLLSPPDSPPSASTTDQSRSILFPPDAYPKLSESSAVYAISAQVLADALHHEASQPLPDPKHIFPWIHGLHSDNQLQLSFFNRFNRKRLPDAPTCLRGVTVVKAGGNLSLARLKGAIAPEEILMPTRECTNGHAPHCKGGPCFIDIDPLVGFSVRNFQIQACKMATISDIVVYGDDLTPRSEVDALARLVSRAQQTWRAKLVTTGAQPEAVNTFVVTDSFETFETNHPDIVALSSTGLMTGKVLDFLHQERLEMWSLSRPSEISKNVFLGPTPDPLVSSSHTDAKGKPLPHFDILIEASDFARMPEDETLDEIEAFLDRNIGSPAVANLDFPSSGSVGVQTGGEGDVEKLISMCRWIRKIATSAVGVDARMRDAAEGEHQDDKPPVDRRIMIHCTDGYTESSLLALAYLMYTEGIPAHEAWVRLHREKGRNFFAYQADKNLLECIERRIMWESPSQSLSMTPAMARTPLWTRRMDGSMPSRIRPHLYLGNLNHATNPGLLRELGITHILSVGEPIRWHQNPEAMDEEASAWPAENFLFIDCVQDNGVDPLTSDFDRCLEFIANAKAKGGAALVHCRVGVSRSATICIAEVMNELGLSFPRAYCFVRARRLNVIIQPHLLFAYELLKWEETQCERRGVPIKHEAEWATIAREIAMMNKPYCRE